MHLGVTALADKGEGGVDVIAVLGEAARTMRVLHTGRRGAFRR